MLDRNEEKKEEAGQESGIGNWFEGVQSLTTIFTSLFPSSMDDAGVMLGVGPKNNDESFHHNNDESREQKATQVCCLEREHVQTLTGSQDVGPLLLLLPGSTQHCQACMLKVANVFRGCLRAVCLEGTREEVERIVGRGLAEAGKLPDMVVFSVRGGVAKSCCYRGDPACFDALSYFVASILNTDYFDGAAAFLRPNAFVRYLSPDSILEFVGHTREMPCALLLQRSIKSPPWFVAASRLFSPRMRFGLAAEAVVRRSLGVHDRQLDPKSPSNPSSKTYMLLFVPAKCHNDKASALPVRQFRGQDHVESVAAFLAACLDTGTDAARPSAPADGSWVALDFAAMSAAALRDKLRLVAVRTRASEWQHATCIAQEAQRRRAIDLCEATSFPPASNQHPQAPPQMGQTQESTEQGSSAGAKSKEWEEGMSRSGGGVEEHGEAAVGGDMKQGPILGSTKLPPLLHPHSLGNSCSELSAETRAIYRQGLTEEVRGRLWLWAVGNAANATAAGYRAHTQRLMPLLERRRSGAGQGSAARAHMQEPATPIPTPTHCCSHQEARDDPRGDPQDLDYVNIDTPTVDSCPLTPTSPPSSSARYSDTHSSSLLYCDIDTGTGCAERVGQSDMRNTCNMSAAEAPPAQHIPSHTPPSASKTAASAHARVHARRSQAEAICTQHTDNQHAHEHAHAHADADNEDASGHVRLEATAPEPTPHMHIMRNTSQDEREDEDKTRQVHNKQQQSASGRHAAKSDKTKEPAEAEEAEERLVQVASLDSDSVAERPMLDSEELEEARDSKELEEARDLEELEEARDLEELRDRENLSQICLDLERTFPGLVLFQSHGSLYGDLRRLLFAVACERPRLGYVQGMSHLGALLLLYMRPQQAYICLVNLLDAAPHLSSFFLVDMSSISHYTYALNVMLARHLPGTRVACSTGTHVQMLTQKEVRLPAIAARLRHIKVDTRLLVLKWWITCFVSVLRVPHVSMLWDCLVVDGIAALLQFTCALLHNVFLKYPGAMGVWDEALTLLTHIEDYDIDVEAVLANMHTYPITNEEVMGVVRLPGILAQLVPHVPHVDGLYVVGKDVKAALGLRVEMHPSFTSAELSHGFGIVTEVMAEGAAVVTWDKGNVHSCRVGLFDEFWLVLCLDRF